MHAFRDRPPSEQGENRQDRTCDQEAAARADEEMTLFLTNGVMLQGQIAGFDQFSLLLERGGQVQLVYKHAVSTLQPEQALSFGPGVGEEGP